jgi:glycosyltransferase involved in cell wall biosynthesis
MKISCVVPTHNRPELVCEAVKSLIDEPIEHLEIIVVDDGSISENFQKVKENIGDKVCLLRNETPMGANAARNRGILAATGDFITFLDDDDLNFPGRIKGQLELARHHDADFVTCTKFIYETCYGTRIKGMARDQISLQDMWWRNVIVSVTPLVEINLIKDVMFDTSLPCAQDYDAWVRCLNQCRKAVNYSGIAIRYRRMGGVTITGDRIKKFRGRMAIYRKHSQAMPPFIKLYFLFVTIAKYVVPDPKFVWYSLSDRFLLKLRAAGRSTFSRGK